MRNQIADGSLLLVRRMYAKRGYLPLEDPAVVATGATETLTGSRNRSPASAPISFGMVAEKNRLCRALGRSGVSRRMAWMKPMSSI